MKENVNKIWVLFKLKMQDFAHQTQQLLLIRYPLNVKHGLRELNAYS